jgi:hypothetical protein
VPLSGYIEKNPAHYLRLLPCRARDCETLAAFWRNLCDRLVGLGSVIRGTGFSFQFRGAGSSFDPQIGLKVQDLENPKLGFGYSKSRGFHNLCEGFEGLRSVIRGAGSSFDLGFGVFRLA